MTENRFEYTAYDDGTESIYDRKKDEYYFDMQLSNIEELLNDLSDENEQLKQQLKTKVIVNKQYEELQRVKKENEELKGEVAHYKLILMSLEQQAKRISGIRRNKND